MIHLKPVGVLLAPIRCLFRPDEAHDGEDLLEEGEQQVKPEDRFRGEEPHRDGRWEFRLVVWWFGCCLVTN